MNAFHQEIPAPKSSLYHDCRERIAGESWLKRATAPIWRSDLQVLAKRLGRSCGEVIELLEIERERADRAEAELQERERQR